MEPIALSPPVDSSERRHRRLPGERFYPWTGVYESPVISYNKSRHIPLYSRDRIGTGTLDSPNAHDILAVVGSPLQEYPYKR